MNQIPREKDAEDSSNQANEAQGIAIFTPKGQSEQNPAIADASQQKGRSKPGIGKPAWIQAISTVAIVCITAFYTYYARQSATASIEAAKAAKDSADAAKSAADTAQSAFTASQNSFRLDQRAWIGPIDNPIIDWEAGKKFSVAIPVKNNGKTPGTNVTTVMALRALSQQKLPIFTDLDKPIGHFVIQPGAVTYIKILSNGIINQADFDAIKSGDLTLWIYGRITYDDVFGRHHWTTFAQTFNPSKMGLDMYRTDNQVDEQNPN